MPLNQGLSEVVIEHYGQGWQLPQGLTVTAGSIARTTALGLSSGLLTCQPVFLRVNDLIERSPNGGQGLSEIQFQEGDTIISAVLYLLK